MNTAEEQYEIIGEFYPDHSSQEAMSLSLKELDDVLTPRGIIYGLDGSRAYWITVPKARAKEARELLAAARFTLGKVELRNES